MRKLGVIGLGHVGATVAYTLVTKGIADELVLIDSNEGKQTAEYYDLLDTLGRIDTYTTLHAGDYAQLKDADVVITAFGDIEAVGKSGDRFGEFSLNTKAAKEVGTKLATVGFNGVIINISNPCDVIAGLLQKYSQLPKQQVLGTGTALDTARMQRAVSETLGEDPKNVTGFVLGEHGESQFTAWSTVRVKNHPIDQVASQNKLDLADLDQKARRGGWLVFSGKRYTCYAVATCAVKLAQAVMSGANYATPVSTYVEKYGTYVGYPAVVGKGGVVAVNDIVLPEAEEAKLQQSTTFLKQKWHDLNLD